jgi:membrane protein DedA with SNARE-associated domain
MGNLLDSLGQLVLQYPAWSHAILAAGIIIQGEITILVAVYLVVSGNLSWGEFFAIGLGTLLVGETLVYLVARILRNTRFGWRFAKRLKPSRRAQTYTYYLKTNMKKAFLAAKFLPAANLIVLLLTGWAKVTLGDFLRSYLPAILLWFFSMTGVAYFLTSGLHYLKAANIFRNVEMVMLIVVVLIIVGEIFLRKLVKKMTAIEDKAAVIGEALEEKLGAEPANNEEKNAPLP